jgi:hypothetical protein
MMVRGLQRGSEVVRHTVDISGATHTFAASRRVVIWSFGSIGILLVPLSVLAAVFPKGLGIYNTWTRIAVVAIVDALVALVFAFFAVAAARSRTEISAGKMTVRSGWQTRTVNITELREITLEVRRLGSSDTPLFGHRAPG